MIHHLFNQRTDVFNRFFIQAAGGGFNPVNEHQNGRFLVLWQWPGIGKHFGINIHPGVFILIGFIEIIGLGGSVVGGNKGNEYFRQPVFLGQPHPVGHMVDDNCRTFHLINLVMRVHSNSLVFDKEFRIEGFANVMIQCACPDQKRVSPNAVDDCLSQIGNLNGMLKSSRSFFSQLSQQRLIGIREFDQGHIGYKTEDLLENINKRVSNENEKTAYSKPFQCIPVDCFQVAFLNHRHGKINY